MILNYDFIEKRFFYLKNKMVLLFGADNFSAYGTKYQKFGVIFEDTKSIMKDTGHLRTIVMVKSIIFYMENVVLPMTNLMRFSILY